MSLMAKKPKHKEKQYCNTFNKDFKILKTCHLNWCTAQHTLIYLLFESYNKTHTPEIMHCGIVYYFPLILVSDVRC